MAGYNDPESGYTPGAAGFFTHLGHVTDITNKFDKDATPSSGDVPTWNGTVYAPGILSAGSFANASFTGKATMTNNGPGHRLAFDGNSTVDGATLTAANNNNKVGWQFNSVFQGGFANEAGWGIIDPDFIFGHNLFTTTGSSSGALTGIDSAYGTLMELHIYTPSATLSKIFGGSSECAIEATGTSTTIASVMGFYAKGPRILAGTVTSNLSTLRIDPPEIISPGSVTGFSTGLWCRGAAIFEGLTPNVQNSRKGVYLGGGDASGQDPGVEWADGVNTWRVDINGSGAAMRWLKAGVTVVASLSFAGQFVTSGLESSTNSESLVLKSADGTRYRIKVANGGGSLTIAAA